jgi:hypothetical protein
LDHACGSWSRVLRRSSSRCTLRDDIGGCLSAPAASGTVAAGKGAFAPCPPSIQYLERWWARCALPTLHDVARLNPSGTRSRPSIPSSAPWRR